MIVRDLPALEGEAASFVKGLVPKEGGATLVTLSGELGAGKTAFVKAAARALGIDEVVNSPTFVLEKIYALSDGPFKKLVHIDTYRLEKGADLAPLGFEAITQEPENLIFIEWPERVHDALPKPAVAITIRGHADGAREITYG